VADETTQGVHPFTVDVWRALPECYRTADRVQGFQIGDAWHGLNRDPRFITGWDGWDRSNTSTKPWEARLALSRRFRAEPNVPVLVRSFHDPRINTPADADSSILGYAEVGSWTLGAGGETMTVRHTVRNHTGDVVASATVDLAEPGYVDTWATPDRYGTLHVTVDAALPVPDSYNIITGIHVGTREATWEELPDLSRFTVAAAYPVLRFLDGVGHQAGYLADVLDQIYTGGWTDPYTAPDSALPFLAAVLGLPRDYAETLTRTQLRAHLVALAENGRPQAGTARAIEEVAAQWLSGEKQATVIPAHSWAAYHTPTEQTLIDAMGYTTRVNRVIVSESIPNPARWHRWMDARHASRSVQYRVGVASAENNITNPRFEFTTDGWSATGATLARDTARFETGTGAALVTPSDVGWYLLTGYMDPMSTGTSVVRFRVYSETERRIRPYVWKYDGGTDEGGDAVNIPAGVWTTIEYRFTTTVGQRYRPSLRSYSTDDLAPLWVDRVYEAREVFDNGSYFDGDTPDSAINDIWVRPSDARVSTWNESVDIDDPAVPEWVTFTTPDVSTQAQAVINEDAAGDITRLHTLLLLVRANEVPDGDMVAFQDFLNTSGVVPAGHVLTALERTPSWEEWQAGVGSTWGDMHVNAPRWVDQRSAGINL